MNRNFSSEAVILALKPLGENDSLVTMITKSRGIVKAMLYGGSKSKLRSLCSQWNAGVAYIYENPEKNQLKISDFDVKKYHLTFSESLFKSYASLLAAELVIKTECAGSIDLCWPIFNGFLDGLELSNDEQGMVGLVRFLWRFVGISGIQPDTEVCCECGGKLLSERTITNRPSEHIRGEQPSENANTKRQLEHLGSTPSLGEQMGDKVFVEKNQNLYYNIKGNGFVCQDCAMNLAGAELNSNPNTATEGRFSSPQQTGSLGRLPLSNQALRYLHAVTFLSAKEARNQPLDKLSYEQIKAIVFTLAENAASSPLNTIRTGMGIL